MSLTLIIPFLNEKKNLIKFFKDIRNYKLEKKFEIIFIDDGSNDSTWDEISNLCTTKNSQTYFN